MVAVKGRLNPHTFTGIQNQKVGNKGQLKNFKIYAELDKVKVRDSLNKDTKVISLPRNMGSSELNVSDSKSGIKNSEKIISKPVKINVRRKVLADISNVKGTFSRTEKGRSTRLGYKKDLGNKEASSLDKALKGRVRSDVIQATSENKISKKPVDKTTKATSDESKTKLRGRNSAIPSGRKSLPVFKKVDMERSGMPKDHSDKSEKVRAKHGFPVKSSVRRTIVPNPAIVPKLSNLSSRPWGNRVSDGFVIMASRAENKVEVGVLSRKSLKPTVKTTSTVVNCQRGSKSNVFAMKKLRSSSVGLPKKKLEKISKDNSSDTSDEKPAPQKVILGVTENIGSTSSDVNSRRNYNRRNSYTGLLISRSKECRKLTPYESLPDIYNDRNHLEVTDYVDDIYQYYWVTERLNPILKNYMDIQRDLTPLMRGILINWLIEVHMKFDLMEETLFLTVTLLDRYLSLEIIKKNEMQLVGLTALLLASKYEDFWHPPVTDLLSISAESYTRDQMLQMEKTILKKLKFRLNEPTIYVFMLRFLRAAQLDTKIEHLAFYLIELSLVEYEALNYKPSMLCASAVYVARCTMKMTPAWTSLLIKHARYEESQIRGCAEMILKFHKAAKRSLLKVTYEKYMKSEYSKVAIIKPLDRLS